MMARQDVEQSKSDGSKKYPKSVFFIVSNEFCERFSYYGMRAVLTLYFINVLKHTEDEATEGFHAFAMACYFTPVIGAIIADSVLGKFRTILYISILYAIGNIVLSYASYVEQSALSITGLVLIAFGTGGIKPCVAAFGGDQFGPNQKVQLQQFFSLFYLSINAGSLISTFVTPIFREEVDCSERGDCFPLAFGVPAVLMLAALVLFVAGKPMYKIVPAAKGNILVKVVCCICSALRNRIGGCFGGSGADGSSGRKSHWLEYADESKYDLKLMNDVKALLRVLFLYIPLPIFWALFDQQGSRWTLQAARMNGDIFGFYRVKPDQIQVINPVLIILMIPLFEYWIYPMLSKYNLLTRPLQKITAGGLLAAASFVVAAVVQTMIDAHDPQALVAGQSHLTILNGLPCPLSSSGSMDNVVSPLGMATQLFETSLKTNYSLDFDVNDKCGNFNSLKYTPALEDQKFTLTFVTAGRAVNNVRSLQTRQFSHRVRKPEGGGADIRILFDLSAHNGYLTKKLNMTKFVLKNSHVTYVLEPTDGLLLGETKFIEVDPTKGSISVALPGGGPVVARKELEQGGGYLLVIVWDAEQNKTMANWETVVRPNDVSMFWQSIQYIVITGGEIMFSITGLEFSYSQAPSSMKSVLQAAWLLTTAVGNLIVVIIAKLKLFEKQSYEFIFFAGLMVLDMVIFALMATCYVYVETTATSDKEPVSERGEGNTGGSNLDKRRRRQQQVDTQHQVGNGARKGGHANEPDEKQEAHQNKAFEHGDHEDTTC